MLDRILKLIYPDACVLCGHILSTSGTENVDFACKNCKRKLEYYREDIVIKVPEKFNFEALITAYRYDGVIRKLMLDYKFNNKKYLYYFFSKQLAQNIKTFLKNNNLKFDYILYVPISFKRYLERGYNQSAIIASFVSKELNIPLAKFGIIKTKNNKRQSELSKLERHTNVSNVYKILFKKQLCGKSIILIDDIYTTGATVNECSLKLKEVGVSKIVVATCTRARHT